MIDNDLEGMVLFAAVARSKSLREAGERLGVSGSAVSQALRKLEDRIGVPLVQRTTRSLRLTHAGERLQALVEPALAELRSAMSNVGELGGEVRGPLRLLVAPAAKGFLEEAMLAAFITAHPMVRLDLFFSDEPIDIVEGGFDAGIWLGEVIDRDMIAVPLSGDIRLSIVGSSEYFAHHPRPTHPRDLVHHECINWHPMADAPPYRWEFTEDGREFSVDVGARILTNDPALNLRLARLGVGLTLADDRIQNELDRGDLVRVLDEYMTPFPGFYLYYPQRRHASPALRAFIDFIREPPWRYSR